MSKRNRSGSFTSRPITRRDVLRAGSIVIPAGILLPAWLDASAQSAAGFDFFISTTGSSSNPGTLAAPWDIGSLGSKASTYAGRRVGLIAGTYDVSAANLTPRQFNTPLFSVPSGTSSSSPTYIASCDKSGNYSRGAAWLSAKTAGGQYTGSDGSLGNVPNESGLIGNTNSSCSNITIDGLKLSGVRSTPLAFGQGPGTGYQNTGIVVQNCEVFDCNDTAYGQAAGNYAAVQLFNCTGAVFQNNYVHNMVAFSTNSSASSGHLSAQLCWCCKDTLIQYNTCIEAGGFYGKEGGNQGTVIRYNYVQHIVNPGGEAVSNFTGYSASLSDTTQIYNNVFYTNADGLRLVPNLSYGSGQGWVTPVHIYNNTIYWTKTSVCGVELFAEPGTAAVRGVQLYNNIICGPAQMNEGTTSLNFAAPGVVGYNVYQSAAQNWLFSSNSSGSVFPPVSSASTLAAARSASAGGGGMSSTAFEQNTVITSQTTAQLFAMSGSYAAQFKLASGSAASGAGSSNGTSSGTPVDVGAWGNGATQIGCNFSTVTSSPPPAVPDAPVLSVS